MSNVFSCQHVLRCVLFTQLKQACYHNRSKQAIKSTLKTLFGTPPWHSLQKRDEMVHIRGKFYLERPNSFWKSNCSQEATESQWTDVWATDSSSLFSATNIQKKKKKLLISLLWWRKQQQQQKNVAALWGVVEMKWELLLQSFPYKSGKPLSCDSVRARVKARVRSRAAACEQKSSAGELLEMAFNVPDSPRWWFWNDSEEKIEKHTLATYLWNIF